MRKGNRGGAKMGLTMTQIYIKAFTTAKKYDTFVATGELPFEFVFINDY